MTPKKKTGGVPDANQKTPPVVLDRLHGNQNSAPGASVKKKLRILEETRPSTPSPTPARGPETFATVADWIASPEFAAVSAQGATAAAERKRIKRKEYKRKHYARTRDGLPLKAAEFCRIVFRVPTVPLLPAPGQVVRWPAETIYSPIKARATTPRRYRPDHKRTQWQIDAERVISITPQEFGYLVQALGMTAEDCAAYLRVTVATIRAWEAGDESIPFAAFWLLRLTIKADRFNTRFPQWEGWVIAEDGPDAGKLIDANRSAAFTPQEIACFPRAWHQVSAQSLRADKLQAELDQATAENTRLRKLYQEQGVTRELRKMHERIGTLLEDVGTADLIEFNSLAAGIQAREKAA
jgi:DNA-binding transcriptional regulator YiaG